MNVRNIGVVISREYGTRVKKKSFLLITFLVPLLFAAMCCVPLLIMIFNKDESKIVAVVDKSGIVAPALESKPALQFVDYSRDDIDSLKKDFSELPYSALLLVSPLDSTNCVSVTTYSIKPLGTQILDDLNKQISGIVKNYRIESYAIEGLAEIIDTVEPDISIKSYTIDENGEETASNAHVYMIVSVVLGLIIFMFVSMFSSSVMQSVVEEKQSKIVEVLLSSVDSLDLMFGKIFGVALVALTQFLLWIVLTVVLVSAVFGIIGKDALMGVQPEQITMGMPDAGMIPTDALGQTQEIFQTLSAMDFPLIIGSFLIFFTFGYLLYASMFAAIGSAVENAEDSNNLQMPLTIPMILGYFIAIYAWKAPDSTLSIWGSIIPFTSPIVMLTRIPFGVPVSQLVLSIAFLVLTFILMAWISAKIYRVGILTSGKKATYKDLWKWFMQK